MPDIVCEQAEFLRKIQRTSSKTNLLFRTSNINNIGYIIGTERGGSAGATPLDGTNRVGALYQSQKVNILSVLFQLLFSIRCGHFLKLLIDDVTVLHMRRGREILIKQKVNTIQPRT